jgi:hypothetical protein
MRSKLFIPLVLVLMALGAPATVRAQVPVPPVGPGGPVWKVKSVYLSPAAPRVGAYYTFNAKVWAAKPVLTRVQILSVPKGDVLQGKSVKEVWVGPGYYTFTFRIYCGVLGGNVEYRITPIKVKK